MKTINDVFSKVIVVNLDRRPDRLRTTWKQLDLLGVHAERFPAVDGQDREVRAEWNEYASGPLALPPKDGRPVLDHRQFYLDYDSDLARVAFVEQQQRRKAIASPGAWGLLASMTKVIETAVARGWPSLLILEDDALFHRDTAALFGRVQEQLPTDWAILQLGAMQLHWEPDWVTWHSKNLYKCNGSSIGAHAVGLRQEVLPVLLEACRSRSLPFDIGTLHVVKRRYRDRCFTCFPNLVIQDGADSEIGTSTIFFREARKEVNLYRWRISDYGLAAIRAQMVPPKNVGGAMKDSPRKSFGRITRLKTWLRNRRAALFRGSSAKRPTTRASAAVAALPMPPPSNDHSPGHGETHLVPFTDQRPDGRVVMVLAMEVNGEDLPRLLEMVAKTSREDDVVPIVVTDYVDFVSFRDHGTIFEYLPGDEQRNAYAADLDWRLYELRRLTLLRRKWRPINTIAFGPSGARLLREWQASPLWEGGPKAAG